MCYVLRVIGIYYYIINMYLRIKKNIYFFNLLTLVLEIKRKIKYK